MGKRGPAPTPTALRVLRGNPSKRRLPANEPTPEVKVPKMPAELRRSVPWGKDAAKWWKALAPELERLGLVADIYVGALAAYCDAIARFFYWRDRAAATGFIQETESGYVAQRPEVGFMNRALDDMNKWGAKFGASPSDATSVKAMPKADGDSAHEFLFGRKAG